MRAGPLPAVLNLAGEPAKIGDLCTEMRDFKVIAIDLDGTALAHPEKVNALYEVPNHVIVLHTARSSSIREETEQELKERGIKYHALVMDKLRASVYIDDRNAGGLNWDLVTTYTEAKKRP